MLKLNFNLRYQAITLLNPGTIVATDSKNYLVANFNFISDDWEYPLTAVFTSDVEKIPYTILVGQSDELEENECFIPWEVLQSSGNVYVSVFCGELHTTNTVKFKVVKSGYTEGEIPPSPTPTIYEQILQALDSKQPMLTAGQNITITEENVISASNGSNDYTELENKPSINNVTLSGNKTSDDLNLQGKLTAGDNITIENGTISASGVTSYVDLDDKPRFAGRVDLTSRVSPRLNGTVTFNEEDFRVCFSMIPGIPTENSFFVNLSPNIPINYIATNYYNSESYDFNILKGIFANSGTFKIPIINLINKPSELNDLTGNVFITHYFQDCEYRDTISLIRVTMGKDVNDNNLCFWQITEVTNIGSNQYNVSNSSLWQELTGGGAQIVSAVVNANGTITFTDSEGNTFTTTGSSVIGADGFSPVATVTQTASGATVSITDSTGTTTANISNGQDGNDYILTTQDKDDIADIVLAEFTGSIVNGELNTR